MAIITNYLLFNHTYLRRLLADSSGDEDAALAAQGVRDWYGFRDASSIESLVSSWIQPILNSLDLDLEPAEGSDSRVYLLRQLSGGSTQLGLCYVTPPGADLDATTRGQHWMAQAVLAARDWQPERDEGEDDGGQSELRWVILTNGEQWRLLDAQALRRYEAYLEVDLQELIQSPGDLSALRVFYRCFHRTAFERNNKRQSGLDRMLESSDRATRRAEAHLKACVSDNQGVMAQLCLGFVEATGQDHFTEDERDSIYRDATYLLYRLLFILYAEARRLLPVDSTAYRKASLEALIQTVHEYQLRGIPDPQGTELWQRLKRLCTAIYESDTELGIPAFDGGLFDDGDKPHLREGTITDSHLAAALFDLVYQSEGDADDGVGRIDYRDLSVRHLGSLYEGMIEYRLQIAEETLWARRDGKGNVQYLKSGQSGAPRRNDVEIKKGHVYFSQSPGERRATGTYYTPEYIVDYIVRQTVGRGLTERRALLETQVAEWRQELASALSVSEEARMRRTADEALLKFVEEQVLTFRVCDPAMGSGHFLVNAAHHITNFVVETLHLVPWASDAVDAGPIAWRRQVIEHCIYGVDISPMAVELTKLSLWLAGIAQDRPLSFLDHHLRCGNSLIGARLQDLAEIMAEIDPARPSRKQQKHLDAGQLSMLDHPAFAHHLNTASALLAKISACMSETVEDVRTQEVDYEQVRAELEPYRQLADLWTARHFGLELDQQQMRRFSAAVVSATSMLAGPDAQIQDCARTAAKQHMFFHWDLEFPQVLLPDGSGQPKKSGFDAIIGNPPWMSFSGRERQQIEECERAYYSAHFLSSSGWLSTQTLFGERAISLLSPEGKHAFIVPDQVGYLDNYRAFRSILCGYAPCILNLVCYTGEDVFPDVTSPTLIYVASGTLSRRIRIIDKQGRQQLVEAAEIAHDSQLRWRFAPRESVWRKVRGCSLNLVREFGDPGVHTGNCAGILVLQEPKGKCAPVLEGSDIQRYNVPEPKSWLRLDYEARPGEYFNIRDLSVYKGTRLVIRQTAAYPIATIHTGQRFRNSLLACFGHPELSDHYLLALLNSSLIREFYREQFVDSQQKAFPQVKVGYLRQIPFRRIEFNTDRRVRTALLQEAQVYSELWDQHKLIGFVERRLAAEPEEADVVHDVLSYLADTMVALRRKGDEFEAEADPFRFIGRDTACTRVSKALPLALGSEEKMGDSVDPHHDIERLRLAKESQGTWLLEVQAKLRDPESDWREFQRDTDGNFVREWLPIYHLQLDEVVGRFYHYAFANLEGFDGAGKFPGGYTRTTLQKLHATKVPEYVAVDLEPLVALEAELEDVERKIRLTDDLIDQIVYRLYGLTDEEIAIVESST